MYSCSKSSSKLKCHKKIVLTLFRGSVGQKKIGEENSDQWSGGEQNWDLGNYIQQEINGSESSHLGFLLVSSTLNSLYNTSLKAQGALVHRLQRQPKPIHNNAKSDAHPRLLPLGGGAYWALEHR